MNRFPIYPQVEVLQTVNSIGFRTTLRKEHNGEWFFWDIITSSKFNHITQEKIINETNMFHSMVYNAIILGTVTPSKHIDGTPVFIKDKIQISEKERLQNINKID